MHAQLRAPGRLKGNAPAHSIESDEALLRSIFPTSLSGADDLAKVLPAALTQNEDYKPTLHETNLATVEDMAEEKISSHRGIIVYDYDALSVDDFFDLEEAST